MKNTVIALFMALAVSFAACKKDKDGGDTPPPQSAKLEGTWKLNNWDDFMDDEDLEDLDGFEYTAEMKMVFTSTTYSTQVTITVTAPIPIPPIENVSGGTYVRNGSVLTMTTDDGETDEATILELTSTKLKLEVDSEDDNGNPEKIVLDFTRQ